MYMFHQDVEHTKGIPKKVKVVTLLKNFEFSFRFLCKISLKCEISGEVRILI